MKYRHIVLPEKRHYIFSLLNITAMEYEQYETILYNSSLLIEIKKEELKQLESDLKKIITVINKVSN